MNERDRLSSDLQRVKGRVHNWLDRFFPDFFEVFKDWEGKAAVATLRACPMPQELAAKTAEEVVLMWKAHGIRRSVGIKRARLLVDIAKTSIGLSTVYFSWWQIIHNSGRYISISRPVRITHSNPNSHWLRFAVS